MKKYKTKPINFEGCHPVIAEHLKRGEAILCEDSSGQRAYVHAYKAGYYNPYVANGVANLMCDAKPVETKLRFKKASEIIRWLEDEGANYNHANECFEYIDNRSCLIPISIADICNIAGKIESHDRGSYHKEWLEEVK